MMLIFLNIVNWLETHQLTCLFKYAFHFDCPGCGLQRSAIALLRGNVLQSLKYYPALIPILLFFVFLFLNNRYGISKSPKITKLSIACIFIIILTSYSYKLTL